MLKVILFCRFANVIQKNCLSRRNFAVEMISSILHFFWGAQYKSDVCKQNFVIEKKSPIVCLGCKRKLKIAGQEFRRNFLIHIDHDIKFYNDSDLFPKTYNLYIYIPITLH